MPDETKWVALYNADVQSWHNFADDPAVIQHFRERGWETQEDIAERAGAEAEELKGKALDEALDDAGLSKSGTADEKRARLAQYEADQVTQLEADPAEGTTTDEEEGSE